MKKTMFSALVAMVVLFTASSCGNPYSGLSPELAADLKENITAAGDNGDELLSALLQSPEEQKEGMAFLIAYMPEGDRDTLTAAFLIEEVKWAYKARETFAWTKALPDSIFYNDVLPYASMDEVREPWREMFWTKLAPLVDSVTDVRAAIDTINKQLQYLVGVEYNTKRNRANQAPCESMQIGMASCSGLSILLTDALRTMGIPSRIAGTPEWVSIPGNHNWSEVWIDGKWYFVEYYPTPELNRGWFLDRAGKADKSDPMHWMYATSWKPTGLAFPMVWDMESENVPGVDVTDFYINLYNSQMAEAKNGVPVSIRMFKSKSGGRSSDDRVAQNLTIVNAKGDAVAVGSTTGPTADMNDYLTLYLPAGAELKIEFTDAAGAVRSTDISTPKMGDDAAQLAPLDVELFLN